MIFTLPSSLTKGQPEFRIYFVAKTTLLRWLSIACYSEIGGALLPKTQHCLQSSTHLPLENSPSTCLITLLLHLIAPCHWIIFVYVRGAAPAVQMVSTSRSLLITAIKRCIRRYLRTSTISCVHVWITQVGIFSPNLHTTGTLINCSIDEWSQLL